MFIKDSPNSHGFVDAHVIEQKWKDHFEYLYAEEKDFIMPITIHPDVSGRPRECCCVFQHSVCEGKVCAEAIWCWRGGRMAMKET